MKDFWKGVLLGRIGPVEDNRFEMKIDNHKCSEQLHFIMNKTELLMLADSIINSLLPNKETRERVDCECDLRSISGIENYIKERKEFIEKELSVKK
jgi:hypothetical protein